MTDDEVSVHMEMLENRLMHQEAALEELTRILLAQEERLRDQSEMIKRLREQVRTLLPSQTALAEEDTPPPHY